MKNRTTTLMAVASIAVCFAPLPKVQATPGEWPAAPETALPGFNTADGDHALFSLTTGVANTAVGWYSLFSNTDGSYNTALGAGTLLFNVGDQGASEGLQNTAIGTAALLFNTTGSNNTAIGVIALENNTTGDSNTAIGRGALSNNTTGGFNTAVGRIALLNHETGAFNTAIGNQALQSHTDGEGNTAVGSLTLLDNVTGENNTALGRAAGQDITGSGNVCIGHGVGGEAGVDDRTYIRNVNTLTQNFSAGVNDYVTVRLTDGRLGHTAVVSSRRYKEDIKALAASSEALYALKPVSFRLKKQYDETQALGFGLIAEEVEQVHPDLVYRNAKGQVESVRYEMVNAMLLNEFLKEHRKNQQQEATIARQQKQIEELAAGLQKVSAQVEIKERAMRTVAER